MKDFWAKFWLTAGWLGYGPGAPGTWGTLGGVGLALAVHRYTEVPAIRTIALALILLFSGVTLVYGGWAEKTFGRKDPSQVVSDEVAGFLVAILLVPEAPEWITLGAGFALFRAFDILKPPPIRGLQRFQGGLGILADDLAAGVAANLCLQALLRGFATYHGL